MGKLAFKTEPADAFKDIQPYGHVYSGIYEAPDGVSIDVWVSVREKDTASGVGTVERTGVVIQGGTGSRVKDLILADQGVHSFLVAINYRGSSLTDLNAEWECMPGSEFVSCLRDHSTFSKINPKLNARDANAIIGLLTGDDGEITVNGTAMKASEFVPSGTVRSPANLYTGSFGGVIVGYMLAEENRPPLHNVFFEQVTTPGEHPISDGLGNVARMFDILFSACEEDTSCDATYLDIRANFRDFMDKYHSTLIRIDNESVYAGGVFDRIRDIIEDDEVGRAIRYIGEIANAHASGATTITTAPYGPKEYNSQWDEERPRETYGLLQLDDDNWTAVLKEQGRDFFPGITNRTAMICSFGINRADSPDSLSRYDMVKEEKLPGDDDGTKEMLGYGFLIAYKTYLSICPQLVRETGGLKLPEVSDIDAENIIVYRGGLDIKHYFNSDPNQDEIMAYFTDSQNHRRVITQRFFGQNEGQDRKCMNTIRKNFWKATDTTNESLGEDCEKSNSLSASGLSGW